jgi:type IV pilus assembly protein PilE
MVRSRGFSLVELMVVVGILGILTAIALPSYNQYVIRSNKAAAKAVLIEASQRQEQYIMQKRAYALTLAELGVVVSPDLASKYTFAIDQPATSATNAALVNMPTFRITATPVAGGMQQGQPAMSVNQFGLRLPLAEW